MKSAIQYTMVLLALTMFSAKLIGQTTAANKLSYGYDNNGSRISRVKTEVLIFSKFNPNELITKKNPETDSAQVSFSVKVGPNPTSKLVTVQLETNTNKSNTSFNYTLTTNAGALVYTSTVLANNTTIDLSSLTDGLYLLKLTANNTTYLYKIIKTSE